MTYVHERKPKHVEWKQKGSRDSFRGGRVPFHRRFYREDGVCATLNHMRTSAEGEGGKGTYSMEAEKSRLCLVSGE